MARPEVIGCVWHAHRRLADELGADAPTYQWCEEAWHAYGLGRLVTDDRGRVDPDKLVAHLRVFWANGWRRPRPLVCSVCGRSVATEGTCRDGAYYCPAHADAPVQGVLAL